MNGLGIIKGLWVTLVHFVETYLEDLRKGKKRYHTAEGIEMRRSADMKGILTVQYPEEKLPLPEEFRFIPFLVYDVGVEGEKHLRCTACGICAKACPPQCIWIVRKTDAETGKPIAAPEQYVIDIDLCMNCGFCAEYCPFDAIKMGHDYEIAGIDRISHHLFGLDRLMRPASYYASIRPENYAREEEARAAKASKKSNPDG